MVFENGYWIGPKILVNMTPEMSVGNGEIYGPVTCIKMVKDYEEGINLMNSNQSANRSAIYAQNGYYSREFTIRTDAGMVGINVGIPILGGMFPFSDHRNSFFR